MGNPGNGDDLRPRFFMHHPEGLVQSEPSHPVIPVKFGKRILHLPGRAAFGKLHCQLADPVPDPAVVHLAFPFAPHIVGDKPKALHPKGFHHIREVIIKKFFENHNVMQYRLIDGSFHRSFDLAGSAVAVFVVYQKIGQITVPEVSIKSMVSCQFQQAVDAVAQKSGHLLLILPLLLIALHQPRHLKQKLPFLPGKVLIHNQFLFSHIRSCLILEYRKRQLFLPSSLLQNQ